MNNWFQWKIRQTKKNEWMKEKLFEIRNVIEEKIKRKQKKTRNKNEKKKIQWKLIQVFCLFIICFNSLFNTKVKLMFKNE